MVLIIFKCSHSEMFAILKSVFCTIAVLAKLHYIFMIIIKCNI